MHMGCQLFGRFALMIMQWLETYLPYAEGFKLVSNNIIRIFGLWISMTNVKKCGANT